MFRLRGFKVAKGWEDCDIVLPQRQTLHAAGYDIAAAEDVTLLPGSKGKSPVIVPTGLKAYCQPDECYLLFNRSSNPGKGFILANGVGVIDSDYYNNPDNDGHLHVLLLNITDHEIHIKKGDRIAQLVFQKFLIADYDSATGIRQGGIGSTDRPSFASPEIIYDVDDVLWPLVDRVFAKLKIPIEKETDFNFNTNPLLSKQEKRDILAGFRDPQTFHDMNFYYGIQDLLKPEELGARVFVNSNSYSEAIAQQKRQQLRKILPNLSEDRLTLNVITGSANKKHIRQHAFAFVDDSHYNIILSDALMNILPIKNWNNTTNARQMLLDSGGIIIEPTEYNLREIIQKPNQKYIIYGKDLNEINQIIYQAVKLNKERYD